ncbi:hypothetical protein C0995_007893 [Termitomyces sp. Mi166|nr:hypothetical protein C0995_007893 [Termitomyces sp. Mi166\
MARHVMKALTLLFAALSSVNAYWLMGIEDFIATERLDPIVNPGKVSGHVHSVLGGSNFRMNTNTAALRQSECTSIPIPEDKSNYWFPHLYFQWANGSFTSMDGGAVICIDTSGTTTAFPDDFRMLTGDPTLRTYDPKSFAQQAVTFLCLDFNGVSTRWNSLPSGICPSGIRAQINFPSCWDGKNVDSPDHKSHVAFPSGGPDSGTCSDPNFPVTLPRIFLEVYWSSNNFDDVRSQAMNSTQPFVYAYGDPTGYGYHADFLNGWDKGVLQRAVDNCHCNPYGDPTCCVNQGIFNMNHGQTCRITKAIEEQTTGTLNKLPGNNPVQKEGVRATMYTDPNTPALLYPIYAYTGDSPAQVGTVIVPPASGPATASSAHASSASSTKSASSTVVSSSLSSIAVSPSSSAGAVPSSVIPVLSNLVATPTASSVLSVSVPFASVVPPASALHSAIHIVTAQPTPISSDDSDEEDCEEEDHEETDDSNHSTMSMSTKPTVTATASSDSTSVPSVSVLSTASVSHSATHTTSVPIQASSISDEEDCEEEDDDETNESSPNALSAPPSSESSHPTPTTTFVGASSTPTGNFLPVSNVQPACATGKFRHKRLKEQKAQQEKRSFHHARSFHDRFVRAHHARAF